MRVCIYALLFFLVLLLPLLQLRQAHDSASALCRATKLRLATPGAPLASPHTLKGVVTRAAARAAPKKKTRGASLISSGSHGKGPPSAAAATAAAVSSSSSSESLGGSLPDDPDEVVSLLRRPLMAAASKLLDMLARRLLGAEALVNLAGAAAMHAEEANKELHRIAKLTKQLKVYKLCHGGTYKFFFSFVYSICIRRW